MPKAVFATITEQSVMLSALVDLVSGCDIALVHVRCIVLLTLLFTVVVLLSVQWIQWPAKKHAIYKAGPFWHNS